MPIGAFILRRLGFGLVSMLGVSVLVFLFLHLIPGDPVDHLGGGQVTPDQRVQLEHCLGLDVSMPAQFVAFLGHVGDLSLGHQCPDPASKPTVMALIVDVFPDTLVLAAAGMAQQDASSPCDRRRRHRAPYGDDTRGLAGADFLAPTRWRARRQVGDVRRGALDRQVARAIP